MMLIRVLLGLEPHDEHLVVDPALPQGMGLTSRRRSTRSGGTGWRASGGGRPRWTPGMVGQPARPWTYRTGRPRSASGSVPAYPEHAAVGPERC